MNGRHTAQRRMPSPARRRAWSAYAPAAALAAWFALGLAAAFAAEKAGQPKPAKSAKQGPQPEADVEPAPPAVPKRLYQMDAYDVITLDKANDHAALKVLPLELPDRRLPEQSKRVGRIRVRLLEDRSEEYEVAWRHIEKVEFFEELVLQEAAEVVREAVKLTGADQAAEAQAKYDEAYEYYQWLLRFYPHTEGLPAAIQDYLFLNAGALFRAGRVEEAFAVLEELHGQNPGYQYLGGPQTVLAAMERVGERLIGLQTESQNYGAARLLLERLHRQYGQQLEVTATYRNKLIELAAAQSKEATAHLAAKRFREAHEAGQVMLRIWPTLPGARDLVLDIARQYPLVVVGVAQPAREFDASSLDNASARRGGYLLSRSLVEFAERGPEGGAYASPWGTVQQSADRSELVFELRPQAGGGLSGYDLSRELLALADPQSPVYCPRWASLTRQVAVQNVRRVRVSLRHPHLLPQALLQVQLDGDQPLGVRYQVAVQDEVETRFEPVGGQQGESEPKPVIIERYYAEPRKAIEDLRRGRIDAIDRLLPSDAARLRNDDSMHVAAYAFPSLHVLVPNRENPFLANRVFRRALLYGINREVILHKGLLDGAKTEGSRVLSAALPGGITSNDPAAYAYDESIRPLPYDPVMSAILLRLADQQLAAAADKRNEPAPELQELVLAHPAGELPRFVAHQIQAQWEVIGVKCVLRELPPGQTRVTDGKFDVLYAEFSMREPLVEAAALFGAGGPAETNDPFISLTLRRLNEAPNWKVARSVLHELHRLLSEDVTVLPLWQMIDYFVYQTGVTGLRDRPIAFYQDVEQWRVVPPLQQE